MSESTTAVQIYLLRHGEVRSHRGDVPITEEAKQQAEETGAQLAAEVSGGVTVLSGETRRAVETADHLSKGLRERGGTVAGPTVSHALRNPDLYLAGCRVNMVSSYEAFAAQVSGLKPHDIADLDFFAQFVAESDRVGWWLQHPRPPGEGSAAIAARIESFARSFVNPFREERSSVVAVTHSPLLRAVGLIELGSDIGEPAWVSGLKMDVARSGEIQTTLFSARE